MPTMPQQFTLDPSTADFITHHISMVVASASRDNLPSMSRAYGCAVSADCSTISVMLLEQHCQALLADLRDTGRIAVVASNPSSHKTIQIKGHTISISSLEAADRQCMQKFVASFSDDIKLLGYTDEFCQAITPDISAAGVRIRFQPSAMFIATPGPKAGDTLKPAS